MQIESRNRLLQIARNSGNQAMRLHAQRGLAEGTNLLADSTYEEQGALSSRELRPEMQISR
ncbi:hypothetical protein [Undibacterium terreum]|uniref:hypothetical protein n=1 Tax=Undibacterium terreum TaxID=1224302 RepID=UPI00166C070D|nr:hypothetical protein [Undibacterium terreum]